MSSSEQPVVGVLFVHGMGEQQRGDTLLGFGSPVIAWLNFWLEPETAHDPRTCTIRLRDTQLARAHDEGRTIPSHTTALPERGVAAAARPIVFCESWWAEEFRPASFQELLRWGIGVLPFVLHDTVKYQLRRPIGFTTNLQLPLTLILGPILQLSLLILLPLAILPIFRNVTGRYMTRIASSFGDPYIIVSDQVRLSAMVQRVQDDLAWLRDQRGCTSIYVVAHSQGCAVAYEAIDHLDAALPDPHLITFGSAIPKLERLIGLRATAEHHRRSGLFRSGAALLVAVALTVGWSFDWLGLETWWAPILWLAGTAFYWLGGLPSIRNTARAGARKLITRTGRSAADPVPVRPPGRVPSANWVDLGARSDPVSLAGTDRMQEIRNRDSVVFDHTSYWRNPEQFVSRVALAITEKAGWSILGRNDQERRAHADLLQTLRRDRSQRVTALTIVCSIMVVASLVAIGVVGWRGHLGALGRPVVTTITRIADAMPIPFEGLVRLGAGNGDVASVILGAGVIMAAGFVWFNTLVFPAWVWWCRPSSMALTRHGSVPGFGAASGRFFFLALAWILLVLSASWWLPMVV